MSSLEFQKNLIIPENNKETFTEYDNIDFLIAPDVARNLVGNSIRITGNLRVLNNGANVAAGDKIYYDEKIGIAQFRFLRIKMPRVSSTHAMLCGVLTDNPPFVRPSPNYATYAQKYPESQTSTPPVAFSCVYA